MADTIVKIDANNVALISENRNIFNKEKMILERGRYMEKIAKIDLLLSALD
jgi:hypothetical protein